jgi:hypothetical protein
MEIKLDGFDRDIPAMVRRLHEIDDQARKKCVAIMREVVGQFKAEAVKRAPIEFGNLEKSFSEKVIEAALKDEVVGVVWIAANALASDYALYMHEFEYELGEKSQDKQDVQDVTVGRKYLERALTENEKAFGLFIYRKLKQYMDGR